MRIELTPKPWEGFVLPLNYSRKLQNNKKMEQVTRIELVTNPWQGFILPLNYTCTLNI